MRLVSALGLPSATLWGKTQQERKRTVLPTVHYMWIVCLHLARVCWDKVVAIKLLPCAACRLTAGGPCSWTHRSGM